MNKNTRAIDVQNLLKFLTISMLCVACSVAQAAGGRVVQTDDLPNFGSVRGNGILWGGSGTGLAAHTPWITSNTSFRSVEIPLISIGGQSYSTAFQYENGMIAFGSALSNPGSSFTNIGQFSSGGQQAFVIAAASADYATRTSLPNILGAPGFIASTNSPANYYAYASGTVNFSVGDYANTITPNGNCSPADYAGAGFVESVNDNRIQLRNSTVGLMSICYPPGTAREGIATRFTWQGMSLESGAAGLFNSQIAIWDVGTSGDGDVDIFLAVGGRTYNELGIQTGTNALFAPSAVGGLNLGTYRYEYDSNSFATAFDHFKVRSGVICGVLNEGAANESCVVLPVKEPTNVPLPTTLACLLMGLFLMRKRG
jgi:hypothetical protein